MCGGAFIQQYKFNFQDGCPLVSCMGENKSKWFCFNKLLYLQNSKEDIAKSYNL